MCKPTGNLTFLFTDIEGSTKLAQKFHDTLPAALEIHQKLMSEAIRSNNGFIFENIGDGFCAAFEKADDAVRAAVDAQTKLAKEKWTDAVVKVRMGIHSGNAEWNGNHYMGYMTLARSARIMSAGFGEQILLSNDTYILLEEKEINGISYYDLGERRLKDVIKPIKLYQVKAPGLREDFPALRTLDARPNNVPVQLSSFIGREKELKQVKELLSDTHLLTLTGTGGTGKSRLALQTGADVIDDFVNGVWFVDLAPLSDPQLLTQSVMLALGIMEDPKNTQEKTLTGFLKDKEILIILDNCEHIIDTCSKLAETLLSNSPKLKILATSREALKCSGELVYRVPSLSSPVKDSKETEEQITKYESVRLFIERAQAINTDFRITGENSPALAEICSRLDGIPLAIELAAARTKILSVEKIQERLDDSFSLLTGGKRTSMLRQQTLRALIDWSYDLLSDKEKILWSRLSVFKGGWTLEAAEEICSDELLDQYEIIELLQNLFEKSIIVFYNENERYRMLETIRQYGKEKLIYSDKYNDISEKHLQYYTELAETANLKLRGPDYVNWLKVLDDEKSNMEKGLKFSGESGDIDSEARLAGALGDYWDIRGQFTEGLLRFHKIYLNIPETINSCFNKILFLIGKFEFQKGEIEKAKKFLDESHENNIKLNDKTGICSTLIWLGVIFNVKGEYDKAIVYFKESLSINREIGDKRGIANCLNNLGNISKDKGEYDKATDLYEESLSIRRSIGNKRGIANCLNNLGNISKDKGEYDKATDLYEESLSINRDIGDKRGIARCLNNLGIIFMEKGEYYKANELHEESLSINREIGDKRGISNCLNNLGSISTNKGEYDKATNLYEESLSIDIEIGYKIGIASCLNNLGMLSKYKGEYDKATDLFEESLSIDREIGYKIGIASCLNNLGMLSQEKGEYDKATDLYEESLSIRRAIGNKRGIAICLNNLGNISFYKGEYDKAQEFYLESLSHYIDLGSEINIVINILRLIELHIKIKSDIPLIKLLGFVKHYSELKKIIFPETKQKVFDESISKLKEDVGEEEFYKSFEKGKSMTIEDAVEIVIGNI